MDIKNNFAVFADLENTGGKVNTLSNVIEKVKIKGDILIGKAYGYTERYSDLKPLLLSNTFSVVPSLRWGAAQKNNMDIQLVIDALEVAYTNDLINCFCIVSGDSDYTPLVGKLKAMGKFVLGISRSEVASQIFINACSEFIFLESVSTKKAGTANKKDNANSLSELESLVETVITDKGDETMFAAELKNAILRLRPDFLERNYGFNSFGKLLEHLSEKFGKVSVTDENNVLTVRLTDKNGVSRQLTKDNWSEIVREYLNEFKQNGFDRINPSILKSMIVNNYPDFEERQIGYKRFSDMMRKLESNGMITIEMDEGHNMLLRIK